MSIPQEPSTFPMQRRLILFCRQSGFEETIRAKRILTCGEFYGSRRPIRISSALSPSLYFCRFTIPIAKE